MVGLTILLNNTLIHREEYLTTGLMRCMPSPSWGPAPALATSGWRSRSVAASAGDDRRKPLIRSIIPIIAAIGENYGMEGG